MMDFLLGFKRKYLKLKMLWGIWIVLFTLVVVKWFVIDGLIGNADTEYLNYYLCFVLWSGSVLWYASFPRVPKAIRFASFMGSFLVAVGLWYALSYSSYYNGARASSYTEAKSIYKAVSGVLKLNISDGEKKNTILDILNASKQNKKVHVIVEKNGEIYYEKKISPRMEEEYRTEHIGDLDLINEKYNTKSNSPDPELFIPFENIIINNDTYSFIYDFANKPDPIIGITRAVTISAFGGYVEDDTFITKKSYERSMNFVFFYIFLYVAALWILGLFYKKRELANELEERNSKLAESHDEIEAQKDTLQEQNIKIQGQMYEIDKQRKELEMKVNELKRFELMYSHMIRDVKQTAEFGPKQQLQSATAEWEGVVKEIIRSIRHSVKNIKAGMVVPHIDLNDLNEQADVLEHRLNEEILDPLIKNIVAQLSETVNMIDMSTKTECVEDVYNKIYKQITEKHFTEYPSSEHITVKMNYNINENYKCNVNIHRLLSVIQNLAFNTEQAFNSVYEEYIEEDKDFESYFVDVSIGFSICDIDGKPQLKIEYKDNAIGFPDDIVSKIYKMPVRSEKEEGRNGEGTMYISFFVENMNGTITATNEYEGGRKFAVSTICLPVDK